MTLSKEDGQLYYRLWLPLLDYVNNKYKVNKKLSNMAESKDLDPGEVKQVADRLWDDVTVIDEYLLKRNDLPEEHRKMKKFIRFVGLFPVGKKCFLLRICHY